VFEGVEGAGKSTQVRRLADWCEARGVRALVTREPGGTSLGEEIRRALLHGGAVPARSELLLYLAARAALVDAVIQPALGGGTVVIADRYELSTLAYQGFGRDLALSDVKALNAFATGGLRPDLTLLLEVTPEAGRSRNAARQPDRIEREAEAFHARVAAAYDHLAAADAAVVRIDGSADTDTVARAIRAALVERYPETFADGLG
jgi:dTMP kinase